MSELYLFQEGSAQYGFSPTLFDTTLGGITYKATPIVRSAINLTDNFAKSPLAFRFDRTHTFARRILNNTTETSVLVTVFRDGLPYWKGRVIKPKAQKTYIELYCESLFAANIKAGAQLMISTQCWHTVYSPQCGAVKELFASVYTPTFINSVTIDIPAMTEASGYFEGGFASLGSEDRHISEHVGTTITLFSPFSTTTGNIVLYPGCDLSENTCKNRFNRLESHIGFSRMSPKNPFGTTGLL